MPPTDKEDLKIPLIYFAEQFLTYYWVMHLNDVRQLVTKGQFLYYEYLRTLVDELKIPGLSNGAPGEEHIHTLLEALRDADRLSPKIVTALNRTRINLFDGPVKHALYVSLIKGPTHLDFYQFPERPPGRVEAKTYQEFYEKEITFVTVRKAYIGELKEMYYWFEKAIITAWAEFTDQFSENRKKSNHTGLTLLAIPEPERGNLSFFKEHFRNLGVDRCAYCDDRPSDSIDHVIPWKMVKSDEFWNMLPICRSCNSLKSDRIWVLNGRAKRILKDSTADIVKRLDDLPDLENQIIAHFTRMRQEPPLLDSKFLTDNLYETTIKRINDFASSR